MMCFRSGLGPLLVIVLALPSPAAGQQADRTQTTAALAFLETLDDSRRAEATFSFEDEERFNFHFIPRPRKGLSLQRMTLEQRRAVHVLLRSALSSRGYLKTTSVMQLEQVLHEIEASGPVRDPELYFVSLFGSPGSDTPWGWRVEGHHLSLNYTSVTDELTIATPAFFGANPAEVRLGPHAGLRVLGAEEDAGRALVLMLDPDERATAIISDTAPREIITGADRHARLERFEGLPAREMSDAQQAQLRRIIGEYVENMRPEIASRQLEKIERDGFGRLFFAWAGSLERGEPHYYRVHGPSVLLEYDNTQNDANHVHAVWRDLEDDFGGDALQAHYERHEHE